MPRFSFYQNDNGYALVTGECPKGFKGILYAAWQGSLDRLEETLIPINELCKWQQVKDTEVPDEWFNAFARKAQLFKERKPEPEPKPGPKPTATRPVEITVKLPKVSIFQSNPVTWRELVHCVLMLAAAAALMALILGVTS